MSRLFLPEELFLGVQLSQGDNLAATEGLLREQFERAKSLKPPVPDETLEDVHQYLDAEYASIQGEERISTAPDIAREPFYFACATAGLLNSQTNTPSFRRVKAGDDTSEMDLPAFGKVIASNTEHYLNTPENEMVDKLIVNCLDIIADSDPGSRSTARIMAGFTFLRIEVENTKYFMEQIAFDAITNGTSSD